jgi:hypothetical protein
VTISSTSITNTTASTCQGASFNLPWGGTASTAGVYSHTYSTINGCDSVVNITLTITNGTHNAETQSACETYSWHNTTYTLSGTYTYNYTNASNCPSTDTLHLTINNGTHNAETQSVCGSYTWHGSNYSATGIYIYSYNNANGCPSADTLHLTIIDVTHNVESQSTCGTYLWHNVTYVTTGTFIYHYTNANGCPSADTLHLTVNTGTHNSIYLSECVTYNWHGVFYSSNGIYLYNYSNSFGCNSTDTLHLTILTPSASSTDITICSSELPYQWNGQNFTTAGPHALVLSASNGCDSVATLNLTINPAPPPPLVNASVNICQFAQPVVLSAAGVYPLIWYTSATASTGSSTPPVVSTTSWGNSNYYVSQINGNCESPRSVITVRVTRKPILGVDQELSICYGDAVNLQSLYYTNNLSPQWTLNNIHVTNPTNVSASGTYQLVGTNNSGCTDTALVHLIVHPQIFANAGPDDNAVYNETYQLNGSGGSNYLWSPAADLNNSSIPNPTTVLTEDTQFTLTVSDDYGCSDIDTVNIRVLKGPSFYVPNAFTPNGDGLNDNFKPTYVGIQKLVYFRIYDRFGALVFETSNIGKAWNGIYKGKMQNTANFVYIVKGIDKNGVEKVLKGNVLLIH